MGKYHGERPIGRPASKRGENSDARLILGKMRAKEKWLNISSSAIGEFHKIYIGSS
jgi:hypothetical protein